MIAIDLEEIIQNAKSTQPKDMLIGTDYLCSIAGKPTEHADDSIGSARTTFCIDVLAYQHSKFHLYRHSQIAVSIDRDLGNLVSLALYLRDKPDSPCTMVAACQYNLIEPIAKLSSFVKLLSHLPKRYVVKEPNEALGLSIVSFPRNKDGLEAHIEYGIDGRLYCEVLDMSGYDDGAVIPLRSPTRNVIVKYVELRGNEKKLAEKINRSLAGLYGRKC